jgi:SAM-dependent methyltransferase
LDRPDGWRVLGWGSSGRRIVLLVRARTPTPSDDEVLRHLQRLAAEKPNLRYFGSLVAGHQYLRLYQLARTYVPPGARVLDWGVGNGHFSLFLIRADYEAVGYSLFPSDVAKWLGDREYRLVVGDSADPVSLPFGDASFDAVVSVGVLEHVRETGGEETASLREVYRILRPAGTFICYHLPNRYSWIDMLARILPSAFHHTYRYTRDDILKLVKAADLDLVEAGTYALLPRNPLRCLPKRLANSERFARVYDALDGALGAVLPALCQNHYFVAKHPSG